MDKDFAVYSVEGAHIGYKKLINCEYLQDKYPDQYRKLQDLGSNLVIHKMTELEIDVQEVYSGSFCGCAHTFGTKVNLNPYAMFQPGCKFSRTVPHEMLHLIGFEHETKEQKEEFDTLLFECNLK